LYQRSSPGGTSDSRGSSATGAGGRSQLAKRPVWFRSLLCGGRRISRVGSSYHYNVETCFGARLDFKLFRTDAFESVSRVKPNGAFVLFPNVEYHGRFVVKSGVRQRGVQQLRTDPTILVRREDVETPKLRRSPPPRFRSGWPELGETNRIIRNFREKHDISTETEGECSRRQLSLDVRSEIGG
jgi:hypothetical protein